MTNEERDKLRDSVYQKAREAYSEYIEQDDIFPASYSKAREVSQFNSGDMLAQFIAIEIWEVMEGHETLADCKKEAIRGLRMACDEIEEVISTIYKIEE